MPDSIACAQCGTPITDESSNSDPAQRKPCPQCGSTVRRFSDDVQEKCTVSCSLQADVITYPQSLLTAAKGLADDGQFSISVVVAHMACEIATERVFADAFATKGIQYLEDSVTSLLNGYNISNDRIRKLYTALTSDDIQNQPFWPQFKASATRRNKIMHAGLTVEKAEADDSFNAASALVAYLNK